jgi:hypothetical protein
VELLTTLAARKRATPAQLALAGLLAQRPFIVPIPGTTKLHRLEETLGAADLQLTAAQPRELDEAAAKIPVQGPGCPSRSSASPTPSRRARSERERTRAETPPQAAATTSRTGGGLAATCFTAMALATWRDVRSSDSIYSVRISDTTCCILRLPRSPRVNK